MNYLGLAFGLIIVGIVIYLMSRRKSSGKQSGASVPLFGFTLIRFNRDQMDAIEAERFGMELRAIKERAWPQLESIYGQKKEHGLEWIKLDKEFSSPASHQGVHFIREIIELVLTGGSAHISMRPAGGNGHTGKLWFALELHNLYRARAFGVHKVYLSDYSHTQEEQQLWDIAQDACAGAAVEPQGAYDS